MGCQLHTWEMRSMTSSFDHRTSIMTVLIRCFSSNSFDIRTTLVGKLETLINKALSVNPRDSLSRINVVNKRMDHKNTATLIFTIVFYF